MRVFRWVAVCVVMGLVLATGGCKSSRTAVGTAPGYARPSHVGGNKSRPVSPAEEERLRVVRGSENALVREAAKWLGTPYRYAGSELGRGTDCSGLTMEVYRSVLGLKIPRNSAAQQEFCVPLKRDALRAGDLVFFSSQKGRGGRVSHVGLYVDKGVFVHASSSRGVIASHLDEPYYDAHYHSGGRVPAAGIVGEAEKPDSVGSLKPMPAMSDSVVPAPIFSDSIVVAPLPLPIVVELPSEPEVGAKSEEALADSIRSQVKMAF
ncbi:MAG: C40 family peptidase [Muribaculaceae bacterium]|nr:C40 family peptidase [Muribaculaceae bacterium]